MTNSYIKFYNEGDESRYGRNSLPQVKDEVVQIAKKFCQQDSVALELGCGKAALKDVLANYFGLDISFYILRKYFEGKNVVQADMQQLPIKESSVDLVVSIAAIEHVPNPEKVFCEVDRILKKGGVAYLAPAWFCKPWAAEGLPIKQYSELSFWNRIRKFLIPVRDHIIWQGLLTIPKRIIREIEYVLVKRSLPFRYRKLKPNLEEYFCSDSDAFASMDPHMVILYYHSRGYKVIRCNSFIDRILYKHKPVIVRKDSLQNQKTFVGGEKVGQALL